jgi:hypothetical protein
VRVPGTAVRNARGLLPAGLLTLLLLAAAAPAQVRLLTGPTPIPRGNAQASRDLTLVNEKLAVAIAVESAMPYGVPRGAIIDAAPVSAGRIGRDRVVFADFIPNDWSAWPNTYQRVSVLEETPQRVRVQAERDWGKVRIRTEYTLAAQSDTLDILTTMTNESDAQVVDLLSGMTLWQNSGYFFSVPGLAGVEQGPATHALSDRISAYDADWSITLHAGYLDHVGSDGYDLFRRHSLAAGASASFRAQLQIGNRGDLAPVMAAEIERKQLPSGSVTGSVRATGKGVLAAPVVVFEKQGAPFGWVLGKAGRFSVRLPAGDYEAYAAAAGHSQSRRAHVRIEAGSATHLDFADLQPPAQLQLTIADSRGGQPLDARVVIESGQKNLVQFLGRSVFFTELAPRGALRVPLAPGRYGLRVSSGGGFTTPSRLIEVELAPGKLTAQRVLLTPQFEPRTRGWYAADLHHHADQAEAVTPPADVARSQLAAGLDLLFVSDHDSTVNHQPLQRIAADRGMPFLPGMEISPSWGHFNAYPLQLGAPLGIDTAKASVDEVLGEARRLGALAVQVNHPFIPYGYLTSVAAGTAPGGFNPGFDLLEINAGEPGDDKVLQRLWSYWNARQRIFLSAGTDTHDVWKSVSGRVRIFAHLNGPLSAAGFTQAMREGHGYVSFGPLLFPQPGFGESVRLRGKDSTRLAVDLQSLTGLKSLQWIGGGKVVDTQAFSGRPQTGRAELQVDGAHAAAWYALVVEDAEGRKAYSDPIWIDLFDP